MAIPESTHIKNEPTGTPLWMAPEVYHSHSSFSLAPLKSIGFDCYNIYEGEIYNEGRRVWLWRNSNRTSFL